MRLKPLSCAFRRTGHKPQRREATLLLKEAVGLTAKFYVSTLFVRDAVTNASVSTVRLAIEEADRHSSRS